MSTISVDDGFEVALEDINDEAVRARTKFGDQLHLDDLEWQSVLLEELGEAAMLVTKGSVRPITDKIDPLQLRGELLQVGAVTARWVRAIDERGKR